VGEEVEVEVFASCMVFMALFPGQGTAKHVDPNKRYPIPLIYHRFSLCYLFSSRRKSDEDLDKLAFIYCTGTRPRLIVATQIPKLRKMEYLKPFKK
jgi:hypothetical protein